MSLQGDVGSVFFFFFFWREEWWGLKSGFCTWEARSLSLNHTSSLRGEKTNKLLIRQKKRRKIWCGFHHVEIIFSVTTEDPTGDLCLMTSTPIRMLFRHQAPSQWLEMPHLHPLSYPWNKSLHTCFINEKFQLYSREGYLPCLINRETKSDPLSLGEKTPCLIIHLKCLGLRSLAIIYETSKPCC